MAKKLYQDSALARFITRRMAELQGRKSQAEIAEEAGFKTPNVMSMLKNGSLKLALDRTPRLAKALECDQARLFRLALEQHGNELTARTIRAIFGTLVSRNEVAWLEEIRTAFGESDPVMTEARRVALREILRK